MWWSLGGASVAAMREPRKEPSGQYRAARRLIVLNKRRRPAARLLIRSFTSRFIGVHA
jgi:hypothetical protein